MTLKCGKSERGGGDSGDSNREVLGHRTAWGQTTRHNNSEVFLLHLEHFTMWGKIRIFKGSFRALAPDGCGQVSMPAAVF